MGSEIWTDSTVEDIAADMPNALATGPFGSAISSRYFQDSGVPVIRGSNLTERVGFRLIEDNLVFVSREKADAFRRSMALPGDLVFTCWGTIGQVGLIDDRATYDEYVVSNKQMKLTPDPSKLNSLFLYYLFSGPEMFGRITGQSIGSSVPGFNLGQLRALALRFPPLATQRAIAHILGTLDDKIELNRQMNRTLEQMAQAIFKSWFIDFDPVRRNSELRRVNSERGKKRSRTKPPSRLADSQCSIPNAQFDSLFPDSFVDSELGEIPAGWAVTPLDEIADFLNGLACQKYPAIDGEPSLPVIKIRELRQGISSNTDRATSDTPEKYLVNDGDVLFSWSGSLLLDVWSGGQGLLNQHVFKVTSDEHPKWFYFYWTAHHLEEFQRIAADKATTMGHIKRHHLTDATVSLPPAAVMDAATDQIAPLFDSRLENNIQSLELSRTRDTLLPKLISGELAIPEAEKLLEGVV